MRNGDAIRRYRARPEIKAMYSGCKPALRRASWWADLLVDECDRWLLTANHIRVRPDGRGYRRVTATSYETRTTTTLARVITGAGEGFVVDHINGDPLDNRRSNLRICLPCQNAKNRKPNRNGRSAFKGVTQTRGRLTTWDARIQIDGCRIHLGTFKTDVEAAKAYDAAAIREHGDFARLNFPNGGAA